MIEVKGEEKEKLLALGFGTEEGDKLILHEVEYAYAVEKGYVKGKVEMLREGNEKLYKLYSFLRDKGYIPRITRKENVLRVGRKGYRRGEDRTLYIIRIVDGDISKEELMAWVRKAERARKELVLAFVDNEIELVSVKRKLFN